MCSKESVDHEAHQIDREGWAPGHERRPGRNAAFMPREWMFSHSHIAREMLQERESSLPRIKERFFVVSPRWFSDTVCPIKKLIGIHI
jgi:hypothetical protein